MAKGCIHVVARVSGCQGSEKKLKRILSGLLQPTREERGCISYDLLQCPTTPADFVFVEQWHDERSLSSHLSSDHLQNALRAMDGLLSTPPEIRRYRDI